MNSRVWRGVGGVGDGETYAFGKFRLVCGRRELLAGGAPVAMGARALDVLIALVQARGKLVSKDALIAAAWGGAAVEDNTIAAQIAAVRRALGDERMIQTVPGRGYRFVAEAVSDLPPPTAEPAKAPPARSRRGWLMPVCVTALSAAIITGGMLIWRAQTGTAAVAPWSDADPRMTFVIDRAPVRGDPALVAYGEQFERALAARFTPNLGDARIVAVTPAGGGLLPRYTIGLDFSRADGQVMTRVTLKDRASGDLVNSGEVGDAPSGPPSLKALWHASSLVKSPALRREAAVALAKAPDRRDARDLVEMAIAWPETRAGNAAALKWMNAAERLTPGQPQVRRTIAAKLDDGLVFGWSAHRDTDLVRMRSVALGLLRDDPEDNFALSVITDGYVLQGRWEDALVAAGRQLAVKPDDASALVAQAQAQLALGDDAGADAAVARLLNFQNFNTELDAVKVAAQLRFHQGRYGEAAAFLRRAIQITAAEDLSRPQSAWLRLYLAAAVAGQGRVDAARSELAAFRAAVPTVAGPTTFWRWTSTVPIPSGDRARIDATLTPLGWQDGQQVALRR